MKVGKDVWTRSPMSVGTDPSQNVSDEQNEWMICEGIHHGTFTMENPWHALLGRHDVGFASLV